MSNTKRSCKGSNNDVNVLNKSNVFNNVLHGRAPAVHYKVNRTEYNIDYYLSCDIYPEWATFLKSIPMSQGSNNDINVLNQSNVFNDVLHGQAHAVHYKVNRTEYNMSYYLSYDIYPEWATFVKSISMRQGDKRKLVAQHQGARKDNERAFGILLFRFTIIRNPTQSWQLDALKRIMDTHIILYNMIVEDKHAIFQGSDSSVLPNNSNIYFQEFLSRRFDVRDKQIHRQLQQHLIEHIWERFDDKN